MDTLSINSYSQLGQDTNTYYTTNVVDGVTNIFGTIYAGSILAHGSVSKMTFANPLPVIERAGRRAGKRPVHRHTVLDLFTRTLGGLPGVDDGFHARARD